MITQLQLGDITVDVQQKAIKNIHLSVHPPSGRVRISAPSYMKTDTIRVFAVAKLGWIRQQQQKLAEQERETPREFLNRESHFVWGKRYLLQVKDADAPPFVELKHRQLVLHARPGSTRSQKLSVLDAWYRQQLRDVAMPMILRWEKLVQVECKKVHVQRMKTRWGSCNHAAKSIRLNSELAKKPRECLEYIVVHELTHLLEPTHNRNFKELMDTFLPAWPHLRQKLNRLPVRHEDWKY